MELLFPLLIFGLAFVLLIVLPGRQRARMQQRIREMQTSLTVGDQAMMTCGLHGTVTGLGDDTLDLEIAPGVEVTFARAALGEITSSSASDEDMSDHAESENGSAGRKSAGSDES